MHHFIVRVVVLQWSWAYPEFIDLGGGLDQDEWEQWRRNEFESGGTRFFCRASSLFLALLVCMVSAFAMVSIQFGQFIVCCSFARGAPVTSHL